MADGDNNNEENGQQGSPRRNRNPFEAFFDRLMPNFSIGGIFNMLFTGAILAVGLYFVARIPAVRNFLQEHLPEDWQAGIEGMLGRVGLSMFPGAMDEYLTGLEPSSTDPEARTARSVLVGQGVPEEIANVLTESRETWQGFLSLVRDANGGSITQEAFMSQQTLTAMLTRNPQLAGRLIAALPAPAAGGTAPTGILRDVQTAVRAIASDRAALTPLLENAQSRTVLADAIVRFAPSMGSVSFKPGSAPALAEYIRLVNTSNPEGFHAALTDLLSGDEARQQTAIVRLISLGAAHPTALNNLINAIDPNSLTPQQREQLQSAGSNLGAQVGAIHAAVGAQHGERLVEALMQNGTNGVLGYLREHRDLAAPLLAAAQRPNSPLAPYAEPLRLFSTANDAQLDAAIRLDARGIDLDGLSRMTVNQQVNYLTDRSNLNRLNGPAVADLGRLMELQPAGSARNFLTTKHGDNYVNLNAMMGLLRSVTGAQVNQGGNLARTRRVLGGLLGALAGDAQAAQQITGEDLAAFFREPVNRRAVQTMLNQLDPRQLDAQTRTLVTTLKQNWGTGNNLDDGLAEALTIMNPISGAPDVANAFAEGLRRYARNPNGGGSMSIPEPDFAQRQFLRMHGVLDEITNLRNALQGTSQSGGSSFGPGTPRPTQRAAAQ